MQLFAAVLLSLVLSSCGGNNTYSPTLTGGSGPSAITITIVPPTATVIPLATKQFQAIVTGTSNKAVTWSISPTGDQNGSATISPTGLVTTNNGDGGFTINATSQADPTKSATATLTVAGSSAVIVTISPKTANVFYGSSYTFAATVTGNANTAVFWSAFPGTITQQGVYTAPNNGANRATATVTATSVVDGNKSDSATVTLILG